MLVNEKVAIDHGLKTDEYKKICELLKRTPNFCLLYTSDAADDC